MKKLILFCLVAFCGVFCTGCADADEFEILEWTTHHWVDEYVEVDGFSLELDGDRVFVRFTPKTYYPSNELYSLFTTHKSKERVYQNSDVATFNAIAERNGDGNYNSKLQYITMLNCRDFEAISYNSALSRNIAKIEVYSENDYDEEHPANTLLNDIVTATISSFGKLISKKDIQPHTNDSCSKKCDYTEKLLKDVTAEDLAVLNFVSLKFEKLSKLKQNITVTITFDDGEVFTDTVEVNF